MRRAVVIRAVTRPHTYPINEAFSRCFSQLRWRVEVVDQNPPEGADLYCGYGWTKPMQEAYARTPSRVVHCDLAFWSRRRPYYKLALGGRWSDLVDREFSDERLAVHHVDILASRRPGKRVLLCGMSEKAAVDWGLRAEQWETDAIKRLRAAGAEVVYRPKPSWPAAKPLAYAGYDTPHQRPIATSLATVDAVATHHSNCAVDALAAGLPIYTEIGIAKSLSVPTIEESIGAEALSIEARAAFLRQVAWHQWTLQELAEGAWLEPPAPLAGLLRS